ncbi:hypothetical protein [Micromonospora sp. CPCC 205558]|uniref:hypothetical protein n=1 Tax=Micromonospora sp. CPCC 205558 TaxID=3122403 RepID=UPI002FF378F0
MIRIINSMGDRLLGFVAPKATASAADCGSPKTVYRCNNGAYQVGACWTNSNCICSWTTLYRGC